MPETRIIGKNARLYFGDLPLYLKAFEMDLGMELNLEESTPYGVDWREQVLIDGQISMAVNAFMDTSRPPDSLAEDFVTDQAYWDAAISAGVLNEDPTVVTMVINNTAVRGDQAYFLNSRAGSFAINCPRSGLGRIRGNFGGAGQLNRGFILAQEETSFPVGDTYIPVSPGDTDLGAAGVIGANAALHVWKKSGSASFTITIEDTATSGSGWATMLAFTAFVGRTFEYKEDRVDAGKQYQRVKVTNGGGGAETLGLVVVSNNV